MEPDWVDAHRQVSAKMRKRLFRKPHFQEAGEDFLRLGAALSTNNYHRHSSMSYLSAASAFSAVPDPKLSIRSYRQSGREALKAEQSSSRAKQFGMYETVQQAISSFHAAADTSAAEGDFLSAAASLSELSEGLKELGMFSEAGTEYAAAAGLFAKGGAEGMRRECLRRGSEAKIRSGSYFEACEWLEEYISLSETEQWPGMVSSSLLASSSTGMPLQHFLLLCLYLIRKDWSRSSVFLRNHIRWQATPGFQVANLLFEACFKKDIAKIAALRDDISMLFGWTAVQLHDTILRIYEDPVFVDTIALSRRLDRLRQFPEEAGMTKTPEVKPKEEENIEEKSVKPVSRSYRHRSLRLLRPDSISSRSNRTSASSELEDNDRDQEMKVMDRKYNEEIIDS